jgi:hypothetical protein
MESIAVMPPPTVFMTFVNAAGPCASIAHLDDVDLVDAGQLCRKRLRQLRHLLDNHIDDGASLKFFHASALRCKPSASASSFFLMTSASASPIGENLCGLGPSDSFDLRGFSGAFELQFFLRGLLP